MQGAMSYFRVFRLLFGLGAVVLGVVLLGAATSGILASASDRLPIHIPEVLGVLFQSVLVWCIESAKLPNSDLTRQAVGCALVIISAFVIAMGCVMVTGSGGKPQISPELRRVRCASCGWLGTKAKFNEKGECPRCHSDIVNYE